MLKNGQQFKIDSIEELKEAYNKLSPWKYNLKEEIEDFKDDKDYRFVQCCYATKYIYLMPHSSTCETIPNPFKTKNTHTDKLSDIHRNLKKMVDELGRISEGRECNDLCVGKWYEYDTQGFVGSNYRVCISSIKDNSIFAYGFIDGKWGNCSFSQADKGLFKPMSATEVEIRLINEAEKRGFKEDTRLKGTGINKGVHSVCGEEIGDINHCIFNEKNNTLDSKKACGYLFVNGEWAEIDESEDLKVNSDLSISRKDEDGYVCIVLENEYVYVDRNEAVRIVNHLKKAFDMRFVGSFGLEDDIKLT